MNKFSISVPTMYADHHVLKVRQALEGLEGVASVVASSAGHRVTVETDDGVTPQQVGQVLAKAGYPPNQEPEMPDLLENSKDGSPWYRVVPRPTLTHAQDLALSGDFRRY